MISILWDEYFLAILVINVLTAWGLYVMLVTGQLSLGQAGFMAAGAYGSSWASVELGWPVSVAVAFGVLVAAIVAVPVAIGASRVRGVNLIIGTLAVGQIVVTAVAATSALGGHTGYPVTSAIGLGAVLAAGAVVLALLLLLERSRWAASGRAVHDDEEAAIVAGVPTVAVKVTAVILGAAITGLAGAMRAHYVGVISPEDFGVETSFVIALYVLIGGRDNVLGPVAGAFLLTYLPRLFGSLEQYRGIVYGTLLVGLMVLRPGGLVSGTRPLLARTGLLRAAPEVSHAATGGEDRSPAASGGLGATPPAAGDGIERPVLVLSGIRKRFNGVTALDGVDLEMRAGEVVGLIGPNGAGKTTLLDVASGLTTPTSGVVVFQGVEVTRLPPHRRVRRGIARTFQTPRLFPQLTVAQHLRLAADARGGRQGDAPSSGADLGLEDHRRPNGLTYALRRTLQLLQALAEAPVVLLLDEPSNGLDQSELQALRSVVARAKAAGTAILLVDHNLDVVTALADRIAVLDFGRKIAEGPPRLIVRDPVVQAAYMGGRAVGESAP